MKITGKKSISSIIKIFLIILFVTCLIAMVSVPIVMKYEVNVSRVIDVKTEITFLYIAAIPALFMIIEFEKIFSSFEKDIIFSRKIEKRLQRTSIYSILIGIVFSINAFVHNFFILKNAQEEVFEIMYLIVIILIAMIFLILGIGLMVLKNVYKFAIDNKEENDLTI